MPLKLVVLSVIAFIHWIRLKSLPRRVTELEKMFILSIGVFVGLLPILFAIGLPFTHTLAFMVISFAFIPIGIVIAQPMIAGTAIRPSCRVNEMWQNRLWYRFSIGLIPSLALLWFLHASAQLGCHSSRLWSTPVAISVFVSGAWYLACKWSSNSSSLAKSISAAIVSILFIAASLSYLSKAGLILIDGEKLVTRTMLTYVALTVVMALFWLLEWLSTRDSRTAKLFLKSPSFKAVIVSVLTMGWMFTVSLLHQRAINDYLVAGVFGLFVVYPMLTFSELDNPELLSSPFLTDNYDPQEDILFIT